MTVTTKITSMSKKLSKKQVTLGRYIVDNINDVALMNSPRLAMEAGVSEATLTRFVYTLGYSSFAEFQTTLRKEIQTSNPQNPFRREAYGDPDQSPYQRVFNLEYNAMAETLGLIDPNVFDKCVDLLFDSEMILLVGGPTHGFLADYAMNYLPLFCGGDVQKISGINLEFMGLMDKKPEKSVAVIFSYPRYPKETQLAARMLHEKHFTTIGLTDSQLSPIIEHLDYALITPQKYLIVVDPLSAAMAMIHSLLVGIYKKDPEGIMAKLERYEESSAVADIFEFKDYNFALKL